VLRYLGLDAEAIVRAAVGILEHALR
jgi:hypothetical protein